MRIDDMTGAGRTVLIYKISSGCSVDENGWVKAHQFSLTDIDSHWRISILIDGYRFSLTDIDSRWRISILVDGGALKRDLIDQSRSACICHTSLNHVRNSQPTIARLNELGLRSVNKLQFISLKADRISNQSTEIFAINLNAEVSWNLLESMWNLVKFRE